MAGVGVVQAVEAEQGVEVDRAACLVLGGLAVRDADRGQVPVPGLERIAWADAKSDDARACERTLGQVQEEFDHSKPDDDPDWVYWLSQQEIDVMAGRCYTELGKPKLAEPLLANAIAGYDHALVRESSLYLSWLAEDHIQLNDLDQAASIATEALELASRTNSARTDERLRHLAKRLKPHSSVAKVAEFLDLYRSLID